MNPCIITCALTGAEVTKAMNPAVPYTAEEIALEAKAAYDEGASVLHLHVRNDDGTPTQDRLMFQKAIDKIRESCPDAIIQVSTGGAVGMTYEERADVLQLQPEMATLDCGTLNFGFHDYFVNTEEMIVQFANEMNQRGIHYELECFEKGHIDTVLRLAKKGIIIPPFHFSFVLGVQGGMTGEARDFHFLRESLPEGSTYSVAGVGRFEFSLAKLSIEHGGHVRVGLEDNLYLEKGVLAKSNGDLVRKARQMIESSGRRVATPEEARTILTRR
ncbi:MAG: 3-keto-5-aminohexanoate cleavage protein [Candidatus Izemoplasmatales bacterium]|nr:3-keto-5-aminohexanoate cleavage protein [Candidatus Izemoplasmatales bacterium]